MLKVVFQTLHTKDVLETHVKCIFFSQPDKQEKVLLFLRLTLKSDIYIFYYHKKLNQLRANSINETSNFDH